MKRYTSRDQILNDIDKALAKVAKAKLAAQEHLDNEEFLKGIDEKLSELREYREQADYQFRKIKRLETVRLPYLKTKLSEFDTATFPSLDTASEKNPLPPQPLPIETGASSDDVPP